MGGNVAFGDKAADRIDLNKIDRRQLVNSLTVSLLHVNDAFRKQTGFELWKDGIQHYLSGSSSAFFDTGKIPDNAFKAVKPSVGDIDTQVNGLHEKQILEFLNGNKGKTHGDLTLIDFKKSVDQYITLWSSKSTGLNVQVDLEMVDFGPDGKPTPWSRFSHSSAWDDMLLGIKGVAHKYIFRAMTATTLHNVIIRPKTARGKEKEQLSSIDAFSPKGYRTKLRPALDEKGEHIYKNGVPVYDELTPGETGTITELEVIFEAFFGKTPTKAELKLMDSYIGVIQLIHKYVSRSNWIKIADGMANLLFGQRAQNMYRNDNDRDLKEKTVMLQTLASTLGISSNRWDHMINAYYKA